jgi:uncharacterized protein CbrC (UPF0167 family)
MSITPAALAYGAEEREAIDCEDCGRTIAYDEKNAGVGFCDDGVLCPTCYADRRGFYQPGE